MLFQWAFAPPKFIAPPLMLFQVCSTEIPHCPLPMLFQWAAPPEPHCSTAHVISMALTRIHHDPSFYNIALFDPLSSIVHFMSTEAYSVKILLAPPPMLFQWAAHPKSTLLHPCYFNGLLCSTEIPIAPPPMLFQWAFAPLKFTLLHRPCYFNGFAPPN
jgi:hypothetical protein